MAGSPGMRTRFLAIALPFFRSEARWGAFALLGLILLFILGLGGLNVLSSFMNRDFMTAVAERDGGLAASTALVWLGVFAALTTVAVLKAFTEDRLRLRWRAWLTRHLTDRYLAGRAYFRMKARADVDNPDQRMTEDVKTFTDQALALSLILLNSTIQLLTFAGILWAITPWLFLAAVAYTLFGTVMTVVLGSRLVKLDVQQFKKEADLRYDYFQVRAHAEPIALIGGEANENGRLRRGLDVAVENMKGIIGLSRNIGFFTVGFDYLIQLIPLLIVAPMYIRGEAAFGMVTQSAVAFAFVVNAFSLIVKEFQRISTFGAVVERLGRFSEVLDEATERPGAPEGPAGPGAAALIRTEEDHSRLAFEGLTVRTPTDGRVLIKDLTVQVPRGKRLLIVGPSGSGRTSLLRAAAGLWASGEGRVYRPPLDEMMFLPQQPYLRAGPLRDQFLYAVPGGGLTDEQILEVLGRAGFGPALERVGGLGAERDWPSTLSLGEQQLVAFARLLLAGPRFALMDEPTRAIDAATAEHLYDVLSRSPTTYVTVALDDGLLKYHDTVLEMLGNGRWRVAPRDRALSA
jgi:putative ATP-binding cassette transporter